MNENILREILGESLKREYAEFDNAPEHKFSMKHRLAMKRIFARYEKNTRKRSNHTIELSSATMPRYGLKQRIIFALVIVILMTLITGWFFPLHRVTEMQVNWLRSRYDFPNMTIHIPLDLDPSKERIYAVPDIFRMSDDYLAFLSDLEELGIYTAEEITELHIRSEPIDIRSDSFDSEHPLITFVEIYRSNETPIDNTRKFVSNLENKIEFYTDRSKDKARAVEGDAEFASLIREKYLPLHKNYLELLEKLYAERSNDEGSELLRNILLVLDKDDRRHLFKINEFEKR